VLDILVGSAFILEKAVGRENRMQDIALNSSMKNVVSTWLVKQAFFMLLGETRACVIFRESTAFFRIIWGKPFLQDALSVLGFHYNQPDNQ